MVINYLVKNATAYTEFTCGNSGGERGRERETRESLEKAPRVRAEDERGAKKSREISVGPTTTTTSEQRWRARKKGKIFNFFSRSRMVGHIFDCTLGVV